jgi:hypothetical protein
MRFATCQSTMLREKRSGTNATYTHPLQVRTYIMSATQSWSGPARGEVPVDQVRRAGRRRLGHGGMPPLPADHALQAQLGSQRTLGRR